MISDGIPTNGLSRGQTVTLLVGVGLDLVHRHRAGDAFGPIHPVHVRVDTDGRPSLRRGVEAPRGWTPLDDWVGLLRFGRAMGRPDQTGELSWWSSGRRDGLDLLGWLLEWATPEPLPVVPLGHDSTISVSRIRTNRALEWLKPLNQR